MVVVVVPTICYTRSTLTTAWMNPTQMFSGPNKTGCVCKCDAVSNHKHWQEISSNSLSIVVTRATKSRRGRLKALLRSDGKYVRCSSLDFESQIVKKLCHVWECSSSTNEKQLRSLSSYFGRLQGGGNGNSKKMDSLKNIKMLDTGHQLIKANKELESLDAYFQKVDEDRDIHNKTVSIFDEQHEGKLVFPSSPFEDWDRDDEKTTLQHEKLNYMIHKSIKKTTQQQEDEIGDLYLIGTLVSVNIAVFLFEVASPVKNSNLPLFSLPSLYGAKINDLILVGEWWRLVTPMFLHSGVLHVGFSCWTLLTFGSQVCREYGSLTFFLIYVLGGVSGNLTSFLHTPEPTVGGTGPVFAMIGAWLSYKYQNKDVVEKDVSDNMFFKAIIAGVMSCILSNIGPPIDEWTHAGAAFSGMLYGFLTSPVVEVNDSSSSYSSTRRGLEKGIKLVRKYADPCKSFAFFALFIMGFTTLLFFTQPPPTTLPFYDF